MNSEDTVIRVEKLSKKYLLAQNGASARGLRHILHEYATAPSRWFRSDAIHKHTELYALKDVTFDVSRGEVVGIIGRNGAGKSTLLKILSRITEPTAGRVRLKGRVASLLEVGTGFHPELTGRENIYLNGSILGMTRADISKRFDEIITFAEIDKFLDTPVKRYSSGMYVRLAFAVAAHLEPDILVIDEVLAVGDAAFQRKCLGKIGEISGAEGRTVLFVSHNMPMVQALCKKAILLTSGKVAAIGEVNSVVDTYLANGVAQSGEVAHAIALPRSAGSEKAIRRVWIEDETGQATTSVKMGGELVLCFEFETTSPIRDVGVGFGIETAQQLRLVSFNNYLLNKEDVSVRGKAIARCRVPDLMLLPGRYYCSFSVVKNRREWVDYIERAIAFDVIAVDVYGTGQTLQPNQGVFWCRADVQIENVN